MNAIAQTDSSSLLQENPMLPALVRVASVTRETHDTATLVTEAMGGALPRFLPGQFNMLYVYGVGEIPVSISGDPHVADRLVYTIRSVGAVSKALTGLEAGSTIGMRGPFGTHWPVEAAQGRDVLVVAGGIGLAPLRPVIYHVIKNRKEYGRLVILYGARSPRELLFQKELQRWGTLRDTQVLVTVDVGGPSWRGHVGVVTKLTDWAELRPAETTAFVCGPEIMMRFVAKELELRRIPADQTYLSMERNMKCAAGFCGHCQMGPYFICKDGPVFAYPELKRWMGGMREL